MAATPLLWLSPSEVPPLPTGWQALPTEQVVEALKPGPLYENKTVQKAGAIPVVSQSETEFLGYHNDAPGVIASPQAPVVTFTNHTCALRLMRQPFSCIQNVFPKVGKHGLCDTTYFFYAAQNRVVLTDYKGHHPLFRQAHIPVPPLPIQRRIASILSAYDDLIENHRKRIAILEDMARRLYREWFVHFRYPGHTSVPLVDSPLGRIPQGWEASTVAEQASLLNRGISPSYVDEGGTLVLNQKCIRDQRVDLGPARRQNKLISVEKQLRFGDVLINSTGVGTLGRVAQVYFDPPEGTVDSHVTIARPSRIEPCLWGHMLMDKQAAFERAGIGATGQTELARGAIGLESLIVPIQGLRQRFVDLADPWRRLAMNLQLQISLLRRTRDLLLPRLMSGTLSVEALATAEAAVP